MIGRPINGEQADHLARFMEINRQAIPAAFEEADRSGRFDSMLVAVGVLLLCAALCLAQFIDLHF